MTPRPAAGTTPQRTFRIPDKTYLPARKIAAERGEDLSAVVRGALERYVKRHGKRD